MAAPTQDRFWDKPIETLSRDEWEALCDGCGKCCLHKLEDEDTGEVHHTNVACRLLDIKTARCADYRHRRAMVPDCLRLTPRLVAQVAWLPATCAYRLRGRASPARMALSGKRRPRGGAPRRGFGGGQGDQRSRRRPAGKPYRLRPGVGQPGPAMIDWLRRSGVWPPRAERPPHAETAPKAPTVTSRAARCRSRSAASRRPGG
jgi:hypothetical protein